MYSMKWISGLLPNGGVIALDRSGDGAAGGEQSHATIIIAVGVDGRGTIATRQDLFQNFVILLKTTENENACKFRSICN